MKQIKIFKNPEELDLANEFLSKNPPESVNTIHRGDQSLIVINYDDQSLPPEYLAEEIKALMIGNIKSKMTTEISKEVMKLDLIKYEDKLKLAKEEEDRLVSETEPAELSGKDKYDWSGLQEKKIKTQKDIVQDLTNSVNNIKNGISKADESIETYTAKNVVLQSKLDSILTY